MVKSDAKKIKELNKNIIRKSFYNLHVQTAAELSQMTGLSVVTTNALLREMTEEKEVLVSEKTECNGGRPAARYQYNEYYKCIAVIYAYQKHEKELITMVITDIFGRCIVRETITLESIHVQSFEQMLEKAFKKYSTIGIIAFGLPGGESEGKILYNDYAHIVGDEFMKHYEDRYQVPVLFVNDINAAVNGYYYRKENQYKNVAGIFFPRRYSPGAGIIIDGEIYTGLKGFAGEIGFLPNGINWKELNYQDEEAVSEAVGNVITVLACVIAPDKIILYGDFFHKGSEKKIMRKVNMITQGQYEVQIDISSDFAVDFEYGMICKAIHTLQKKEGWTV